MEEHAARWHCQFVWPVSDFDRAVFSVRLDRHGLLDGWVALRKSALCGSANHVHLALLQPLFLSHDRQDLAGADDRMFDLPHDPAFRLRL